MEPPGIIIEVGFVEMLRDGIGWRKGETWCSLVNPDGPIDPAGILSCLEKNFLVSHCRSRDRAGAQ